ncbi:hypothetical protein ABZ413_03825 [Nocardia rhamnosiphila]|uniref:hypothetical protein n=1 Tax=Nocardia rhamnosiphila TaxID=426716 RepID=UPI0033E03F50
MADDRDHEQRTQRLPDRVDRGQRGRGARDAQRDPDRPSAQCRPAAALSGPQISYTRVRYDRCAALERPRAGVPLPLRWYRLAPRSS